MPITSEISVERHRWTRYSRENPRGSGYCEDQGEYQLLVRRWRWRGIVLWTRVLDREEIPSHVTCRLGPFGDTGGWVSKFAEHIT